MSVEPTVHAFLFVWPRWEDAAHGIADNMSPHVDDLTVLYKNDTGKHESGPGDWRKIPGERFYGWQFRESLALNRGDIVLHVQADAIYDDWPKVIARCRATFKKLPEIGVWSPDVYYSGFSPRVVQVAVPRDDDIATVFLTDGVVWAFRASLIPPLMLLDYGRNNLGWGVQHAVSAISMTNNMSTVMDLSLKVGHRKGSGYLSGEAEAQEAVFLEQLSLAQQSYLQTSRCLYRMRKMWRVKMIEVSFWQEMRRRLALTRM